MSKDFTTPHFIVGIGASAGGLKALQDFFDNIPEDTGMSFVLIQHLSSDHKSMMGEILQKHTNLKIQTVQRVMRLKPNHLYLMPNDKNLTVKDDGRVGTVAKPKNKPVNMPVDLFFDTLAKAYNDRSVGVILSGTGTDGSRGIKTLKERGGMVLCQSPESSEFDGMPNASLELGLVDYSGSPKELVSKLAGIAKSFGQGSENIDQDQRRKEQSFFEKILRQTSDYTGVDFEKAYRKTTLKRRVEKRIRVRQLDSMEDYFDYIQERPEEISLLKQEFYIGVTHFFRDTDAWEKLEAQLSIFQHQNPRTHYRIWVAGCSTGEEAYSVAMVMESLKQKSESGFRYKIFATDLDSTALQRASQGVFNYSTVYEIPSGYVGTYFTRGKNDTIKIKKSVRNNIVFSQHDLLTDPPFMHIDLLICRNLLIYFEAEYQENILRHLKFSLDENSILFLGPSETLGSTHASDFRTLNSRWNIFQLKKKIEQRVFFKPNTIRTIPSNLSEPKQLPVLNFEPSEIAPYRIQQSKQIFEDVLQHRFIFAAVFISSEGFILHSKGAVEDYIYFPGPNMSFYECLPKQTAVLARGAVRKVLKSGKDVLFAPINYKKGRHNVSAKLSISKVQLEHTDDPCLLFQFSQYTPSEDKTKEVWNIQHQGNLDQVHLLEAELEATQLRLQKTVQDLEVTNEALQTSNEELLSSNEELQSSNEELQSVNEELHTVNDEFQNKIEELREVNNDIDNLISSTNIGTLFLDKNFCIRKITPAVQTLFAITEQDIGRPFNAFTHSFANVTEADMLKECKRVYQSLNSYEQELSTQDNLVFLMKIQPFRTDKNMVNGVVLTFVDLSELKAIQREKDEAQRLFQTAFASATIGNALFDLTGTIKKVNASLCERLDYSEKELLGNSIYNCTPVKRDQKLADLFSGKISSYKFESSYKHSNESICWGIFYLAAIQEDTEKIQNFVLQVEDITERKKIERKLLAEQTRSKKAEELAHVGSWQMNLNTGENIWSDEFYRICGFKPGAVSPSAEVRIELIHPDDRAKASEAIEKAIVENNEYSVEIRIVRPDGNIRFVISQGTISDKNENKILLGSLLDITPLKDQEQLLKDTNDLLVRQNQQLENFTHIASHNLRSPITNIVSIKDLLAKTAKTPEKQEKLTDMIFRSATDALQTLDDINEALRTSKNINNDIINMHFEDILNKTMDTLKGIIQQKKATITADFSGSEKLSYPRIYLESIFLNLLSNALKYASPKRKLEITLFTTVSEGETILQVQDNGLGINLERHKDKVFGLYKTFHHHKDSRGVGLFMTRTQIEAMGGSISVESEVDKGTCFTINFGSVTHLTQLKH